MSSIAPVPPEFAHVDSDVVAISAERLDETIFVQSAAPRSIAREAIDLFKARVTVMVVITAWAGYYLGATEANANTFGTNLWNTLGGVALVSAGAAVLNEVIERRTDALMRRTALRALATGRLSASSGLLIGIGSMVLGSLWLMACTYPIAGILTLLTGITYACVYTPLKRRTTLATFIGAFPGAMPPLIGWVAARGTIEWPAVALFAILFIWQFPHFMAVAWLNREDYGRAGIRMLPVVEPDGRWTAIEALSYAVLMIPASLIPYYLHMAGHLYWVSAIILGILYLAYTVRFARITRVSAKESRRLAYALLKASVIYLPLLLAILMLDAGRR
jgi:protoheme IX farnesyltransferase